jgi:hypothetical protein
LGIFALQFGIQIRSQTMDFEFSKEMDVTRENMAQVCDTPERAHS